MLVISRRPGQSFIIGDEVEVVILDADHRFVKVGIRAPRTVSILRKELQEAAAQNEAALSMPSGQRLCEALEAAEQTILRKPRDRS